MRGWLAWVALIVVLGALFVVFGGPQHRVMMLVFAAVAIAAGSLVGLLLKKR